MVLDHVEGAQACERTWYLLGRVSEALCREPFGPTLPWSDGAHAATGHTNFAGEAGPTPNGRQDTGTLSKFHPSCIEAGAETHPRMHCLRRPTNVICLRDSVAESCDVCGDHFRLNVSPADYPYSMSVCPRCSFTKVVPFLEVRSRQHCP